MRDREREKIHSVSVLIGMLNTILWLMQVVCIELHARPTQLQGEKEPTNNSHTNGWAAAVAAAAYALI